MNLPFLVSVPHAGMRVPGEVRDICLLTPEQVYADSDGGAAEIYYDLEKSVEAFISSEVARAIVDLNRAVDDFRKDGVIKTHTCFDVKVYKKFPTPRRIKQLLTDYYYPYHQKLIRLAGLDNIKVGIDCHTMAKVGPPIGPDAGKARPLVCISNADGTCPDQWLQELASCFQKAFPQEQIKINEPFKGGYIIRNYSAKLPWLQIELSRTENFTNADKKAGVFEALTTWSKMIIKSQHC